MASMTTLFLLALVTAGQAPAAAKEAPEATTPADAPVSAPSTTEPSTTEPSTTEPVAPDLLLEPAASPAPKLYTPAELEAPAVTTTTPPAGPAPKAQPKPPGAPKPRLLVLDLVDQGAGQLVTGGLSQAMQGQSVQSYAGEVVTTAQLKVALDAAGLQALTGCMSETCMTDLAGTVEAERTLGGSVARAGDDFILTLLLVDTQTGARVKQEQRKVPSHEDLSYYAIKQLTSLILTGKSTDPLVPVAIGASEEGSVVIIDGKHVGTTPVTTQLDPGRHEIRVEKDGFVTWKTVADVQEATPLELHATLVDPGFPLWPFALSTGAISVASLAGGVWFGVSAQNAYDGSLPLGDPAQSYLGHPSPDTAFLQDKKQTIRERAAWADALYVVAATFGVVTVGLFAWELGSAAMASE